MIGDAAQYRSAKYRTNAAADVIFDGFDEIFTFNVPVVRVLAGQYLEQLGGEILTVSLRRTEDQAGFVWYYFGHEAGNVVRVHLKRFGAVLKLK